ncbi:MAG TPA: CinA family protein [Candidatus Limnocylindrales bacterium]
MAADHLVELAERLQGICLGRGLTVAVAESCTGGLVGHLITEVSGSSGYFLGGPIVYSDAAKQGLLGVPGDVLAAHGAVSAQVAVAMAKGARERLRADLAVSVTGIAGPDGGSEAKPVGLTYVAVADAEGDDVRRYQWTGDRAANKRSSAEAALELLLARVAGRAAAGGR